MRHELVGYVLGALDDAEKQQLDEQLSKNGDLESEMQLLRKGVEPLAYDARNMEPPQGLAQRTCEYIEQRRLNVATQYPAGAFAGDVIEGGYYRAGDRRWTLVDVVVAAVVVISLGALVFPAVNRSRLNAQIAVCQNKLSQIGTALSDYGKHRHGILPEIPQSGRLAVAGIYAPKLLEDGIVADPQLFVCDASESRCQERAEAIPAWGKLVELEQSNGDQLDKVLASMGGSYAYNLGYEAEGKIQTVSLGNRSRPTFVIIADTPCPQRGYSQSSNHVGDGQNVLYEDLHVGYVTSCQTPDGRDNFYRNEKGLIAAGTHEDDAVVGCSSASPTGAK